MLVSNIRPGNAYTFQYYDSKPVTWIVDVVNVQADKVHMHKLSTGQPKEFSLKRFIGLYTCWGISIEGR